MLFSDTISSALHLADRYSTDLRVYRASLHVLDETCPPGPNRLLVQLEAIEEIESNIKTTTRLLKEQALMIAAAAAAYADDI